MCGIAGEFVCDSEKRIDSSLILPIVAALRHRGPDQWGYYVGCGGTALLINTRLSIVDLANGKQPLSNEDGSVWVVLNGELYGFADAAADLARRGHRFRTRSDTEIIVHLYEEYGEDFVAHLRGEFAIAVLDQRQNLLYVVRDRFGIKPLYYAELPHSVVFGSEIKALFQHPALQRRLDHANIFHLLHGVLLPGTTVFEGVRALEPGCMLRVSRSGVQRLRYWDLPIGGEPTRIGEGEAVEEFRRLFYESVRLRLHGDVEVGAYVSGGLDSSAVATVAAEVSGRTLKAFTVSFADDRLDEGPAAAAFCKQQGFEHHTVRIGVGDLSPHFERSLWHGETPVANSHGTAKMILSELASRHVKVVLTGEGADEALAGYTAYRHIPLLEGLRAEPRDAQLRAAMQQFMQRENTGVAVTNTGILPISAYPEYDRVFSLFGAYPYAMARALHTAKMLRYVLSRGFWREINGLDVVAETARHFGLGRMSGLSPIAAHQYYLFKTDLPNYILNYLGDRVEMAHSVEGRVPLLDHELVEFAFALPVSLKIRDGAGKHIFRQAVLNKLPSASHVKKRPFAAPSADTLGLAGRGPGMSRYLDRKIIKRVGLFDPLVIRTLVQSLKVLRPGSRAHGVAETLLTGVASIHALHDMFCEHFSSSAAQFAIPARELTLSQGAVAGPAGAEA
jgi:asparagine synthase (glutamine-hydrolysing)